MKCVFISFLSTMLSTTLWCQERIIVLDTNMFQSPKLVDGADDVSFDKLRMTSNISSDYKPEVIVVTTYTTLQEGQGSVITISVIDDEIGIPDQVRDKIFEPFFTTKPTGEGTGLGLSMSYDIVTKGHGGTLEIDSEVDRGTMFKLCLKIT